MAATKLILAALLSAWQTATDRLQQTHQILREEVKRLTDELEIKNRELARKNRLADLGQMAAHVAHEVRNSLVPMTLYLSLLRGGWMKIVAASISCKKYRPVSLHWKQPSPICWDLRPIASRNGEPFRCVT